MNMRKRRASSRRGPFTPVAGHFLYAAALDSESLVLDVGAHKGMFARGLVKRFGCLPWMVEANPQLASRLKADFGRRTASVAVTTDDAESYLNENDSYNYLKAAEGLIVTGPTRTNVMDIAVVLVK